MNNYPDPISVDEALDRTYGGDQPYDPVRLALAAEVQRLREGHKGVGQFRAIATIVSRVLNDLDVVAHNPVQGMAMHKVIAQRIVDEL